MLRIIYVTAHDPSRFRRPLMLREYLSNHKEVKIKIVFIPLPASRKLKEIVALLRVLVVLVAGIKHKANVVISLNAHFVGLQAYVVAKLIRSKFVIDLQDFFAPIYGNKKQKVSTWIHLDLAIEQFLLKHCDLAIFTSLTHRELAQKTFGCRHTVFIPHTIYSKRINAAMDIPPYIARSFLKLPHDAYLLVFCGSTWYIGDEDLSGITYVIQALPAILEKIPNARLVIAGMSRREDERLDRIVSGLRLDKYIYFLGKYSAYDQKHLMTLRAADLLILPCGRHAIQLTSTRIKLFEYLACSKPIIVTRTPEMAKILTNRYHALLINGFDPESWASACFTLWSNPELASYLAFNARRLFELTFHPKKVFKRYIKYITELVGGS